MTPPILQENIEPAYPPLAQTEGMEGTVTMNLLVAESGDVKRVEIVQSSGYRILDNASTVFANKLKFNPARQGDTPIDAWISWVLDYHLIAQEFLPIRYVQKIQDLRRQAIAEGRNERTAILMHTLNTHLEFVEYMSSKKPELNYNQYIQKLIASSIYENWKLFWDDFPLHFLVFYDFICRYPDSSMIGTAKSHLFHYIELTIRQYEQDTTNFRENEKRKRFLTHVSQFLNREYPDIFTHVLNKEVNVIER
jgi:TonB family protein